MSTFQQNQSNGFSPVLLSPSSTSHTTMTNNHLVLFDNSDQGSVDSDYTSLGSSKFYGNGGSSSSLHRQGRSQSIDELASTTTIPTRHFNGTSNVNKLNSDPLQFVKIHPNHELIERAQEQLTLFESRKRLQENFTLINHNHNNNTDSNKVHGDDETDWSKAVENWRQKREQKRKQSVNSTRTEDDVSASVPNLEYSPPPTPIRRFDEPKTKPTLPPPTIVSLSPTKNISTAQLLLPNRTTSKSPSPQRIKGPAKIHELFIRKPVEIRGFGFKLDGGPAQNRPIYISTLEDGSPADKAGLCVDDEIISMNDENIEHMTFDQVRKILKERNLRGSIKMVVKTYEDIIDDNSQTITTGPTTEHSRTPSPQKPLLNSHETIPASPVSTTTTTHTIRLSPTIPSNVQSPVYTFLPYTPPPSSIPTTDTPMNIPVQQTPVPSLNIFAPKPFRSTASINLDTQNNNETNITHSSPIEAFRKMLDPSNSINKSTKNEITSPFEQQPSILSKSTSRDGVNTLLSNSISVSSNLIEPPPSTTAKSKPAPRPLTSIESLLHGTSVINSHDQQRNESPITQVRSSVEKQMNQLQQEFLYGFSTPRDERLVKIPIDLSTASVSNSSSNQQQDSNFNNKTSNQQRASTSYPKRSVHDVPSMTTTTTNQPSTSPSSDRTVNELRVNLSPPTSNQQQQTVSIQSDGKNPQQRVTNKQVHAELNQVPKKSNYEDHSWINNDQRKPTVIVPTQSSSHTNGKNVGGGRRPTSQPPPNHTLQTNIPTSNQLSMFHYGDRTEESPYRHSRSTQQLQKDIDPSVNRHHQPKNRIKSPIRTTINSNNNRVLSVSGKLHCSRCNDELGQGSAMVIESLGLYYHIECFRCFVCNIPLSSSFEGTDVRVRSNRLHCQNCFSDENGAWRSNV